MVQEKKSKPNKVVGKSLGFTGVAEAFPPPVTPAVTPAVQPPVVTLQEKEQDQKNKYVRPGRVKTINGSILQPHDAGLRLILNVANMDGKVDGPLYKVFDKKWPKIKQEVRGSFVTKTGAYKLGTLINSLAVQSDVWVISMLCQDENQKTDVVALEKCLQEVRKLALTEHASVHVSSVLTKAVPELGDLLTKQVVESGIAVSYYEEPTV